jgi:transposase-like protein
LGLSNKKRDEYDIIYNYDGEDSRNYEELDENEDPEDIIEELRGCIGRGDCLYCDAKNAMEHEGHICFICKECGKSVHEDIYYRWAAGYPIEFED